jgi:putative toxin-antitoxin system antitoxin component (TIGR02293 family)
MDDKVAQRKSRRAGSGESRKGLVAKWRKVSRAAETGQWVKLTPAEIKQSWSGRFAEAELDALVIPRRTLARRKARHEHLTVEETDKAFRLARIASEADRVFGGQAKADRWLRAANVNLASQSPLSVLKTEAGAVVVAELLGQIDHGMFT